VRGVGGVDCDAAVAGFAEVGAGLAVHTLLNIDGVKGGISCAILARSPYHIRRRGWT
jgi:hypothetical protein